mmetsp:Transcript_23698/g.50612  ORF Transcript_23698/g.50612 Transcript_23698/m.50612 type:complete len:175 (-) Transcript_23698:375-899(-)
MSASVEFAVKSHPSQQPWFWEQLHDACAERALANKWTLPNNIHNQLLERKPGIFLNTKQAQKLELERLCESSFIRRKPVSNLQNRWRASSQGRPPRLDSASRQQPAADPQGRVITYSRSSSALASAKKPADIHSDASTRACSAATSASSTPSGLFLAKSCHSKVGSRLSLLPQL